MSAIGWCPDGPLLAGILQKRTSCHPKDLAITYLTNLAIGRA
jgi:hypothetical protein